ncbi:MAG: Gfo/Idh/MocA family oxidoreductase, partial [Phycisphaerae bacterium]
MTRPLRVAVIGSGHMGRHHVRIYSELEGCDLVAVIDKDLDRARQLTSQYGGEPYQRVPEVKGELDAVTVAVPTVYHAEVAIPLMERGVSVLIEKPLAPDTASAKQLLDASRRCDCVLQVGHSERFNPVVQAMLRMKVAPKFIETQRISPFTFRSADIGVVFDMMIHDIDIVLHLVKQREYE